MEIIIAIIFFKITIHNYYMKKYDMIFINLSVAFLT